ncbi:hypothetical protein AB0957_07625, partial [Streptomyces zhihengii]
VLEVARRAQAVDLVQFGDELQLDRADPDHLGPAESYAPPPPPPVSIEDDVPEEDDPDLVDSALSGHDLIVRELGATVVEEYTNE